MKKALIIVVISAVIIGGFIVREIYRDKQIAKLSQEIQKNDVEKQKDKQTILFQENKIKLANAKVAEAEGKQKVSKLSLMEKGKTFDAEIEKINKLRKADQDKFEITNDQWNKVLLEKNRYKAQVIDLDMKWQDVVDKLKLLHYQETGKLIKTYKKMITDLEQDVSDYSKLSIRLAKKAESWLTFPTINLDIASGGFDGVVYGRIGFGGSIDIIKLITGKIKDKLLGK